MADLIYGKDGLRKHAQQQRAMEEAESRRNAPELLGEDHVITRARAYLANNAAESGADVIIADLLYELEAMRRDREEQ